MVERSKFPNNNNFECNTWSWIRFSNQEFLGNESNNDNIYRTAGKVSYSSIYDGIGATHCRIDHNKYFIQSYIY